MEKFENECLNYDDLSTNMKEALNTYENPAQNIVEIDWTGWQKTLSEYLSMPFHWKIVWVVGEKGYEENHFFKEMYLKNLDILDLAYLIFLKLQEHISYFRKTLFINYQYLPIQCRKSTLSI